MEKVISSGNEYAQLKQAYERWDIATGKVKECAYAKIVVALTAYNDSCIDEEDLMDTGKLHYFFGED